MWYGLLAHLLKRFFRGWKLFFVPTTLFNVLGLAVESMFRKEVRPLLKGDVFDVEVWCNEEGEWSLYEKKGWRKVNVLWNDEMLKRFLLAVGEREWKEAEKVVKEGRKLRKEAKKGIYR